MHRYMTNLFKEDVKTTIGVDFATKNLELEGKKIRLQIWDFGGEERFRFLFPSYILGARGGIFMYDITNYSTLAHIDDWLLIINNIFDGKKKPMIPILVVGGKADLSQFREVTGDEAIKIAESRGAEGFIECSSKKGENIQKIFGMLARLILKHDRD